MIMKTQTTMIANVCNLTASLQVKGLVLSLAITLVDELVKNG